MGAKDLYLLQIVQYSANESEKKPSHWAYFIHFTDKTGNVTGDGELHELAFSPTKGYRYVQRRAKFLTQTFRGACTLGLFYKKNLYKILDELEAGKVPSLSSATTTMGANPVADGRISQAWVEDRLEAMRRAGVVLLGPSFADLARRAYQNWRVHREERKVRLPTSHSSSGTPIPAPASTTTTTGASLSLVQEDAAEIVKRHYSYPFTQYAKD
ncbi:hypothetical protein PIIN_05472 [Serendipita indica DSM 11827]|uniref:Uncharacterized protein n=1 Tax=Serendipita indica (strain DSM 11827) TaxID=1109443 RepID=G4TJP3_SERID|nr:hypothetical protein PIIN_05472 [Serendipita indica DSM 11827]